MFAAHGVFSRWCLLVLTLFWLVFVKPVFAETIELSPENELLLELRLDGKALGQDILGYQRGEEFFLSLDELSKALGLSIAVDAANGTASGWYISEDRLFSLNLADANVSSGDNSWSLGDGEAVLFQGGLYVESTVIEKWFPLTLSTVVRELYLNIETTEVLPIQQRINRRARIVPETAENYQEIRHPLQDTPYQFVGPHITNLRFGYSTTRESFESDAQYKTNFASLSRGDLGWMTSTLALAGGIEESLTTARLKLERTALNGPLGVNHIEVGDVDAGGFRGALISGASGGGAEVKRPDSEKVTLEGSLLPDWDIELYQNSQLLSIQTTGQDGRYLFEDIELVFGENRFEFQFFGPNGELESREEFYYLGPAMLAPGNVSYQFSAVQNGKTVFGIDDNAESVDAGSGIYSGSVNVGLTSSLTVNGDVSSREIDGKQSNTGAIGLGFSTSLLYGSVQYATATLGLSSIKTSLRTRLRDTSINLDFTRFFYETGLVSEPSENVANLQKWQSDIDISSSLYDIPIKFGASFQERENATSSEVTLATTVPLLGAGYLSSSVWYVANEERLEGFSTSASSLGGQTSFNTTLRPWTFRLAAIYGLSPDANLRQLIATSNLRIDSNMNLSLGVRQSATTDIITYDSGINWLLEYGAISARVSFDSDDRWTGVITVGTTVVQQPRTLWPRLDRTASVNSGRVEARVYEDVNDVEPQPYEGATVSAIQSWRKATTNVDGVAYLSGVQSNKQIDVELDESTLEDYELRSINPGVSVIPRPGSFAIVNFPLVRTAELEGYLYTTQNGNKEPVSRALITLKTPDGDVVTQTRTAFDGFYLFEGVAPGEYQVSLESHLEKRVMKRPAKVAVLSTSGVIGGLDYKLRPLEANLVEPGLLAAQGKSQQNSADSSETSALPTLAGAVPRLDTAASPQQAAKPQTIEPETTQTNDPQAINGNWFVQIGAYDSRAVAQASWDRLRQGMQVLQGETARFMPYQSMTRLLVGPGRSEDAANMLCQQLKAASLDCLVRQVE